MRLRLFAGLSMILGLGISLVAIEAALRIATPGWLQERMRELSAGVSYEIGSDQAWPLIREHGTIRQFVPNSMFMVRNYEYEHIATFDEIGGRVTPYPPVNDGIIPWMGDSFTFGIGARDADTFVSRLGERSSYRFVNLGVPGSSLYNQLDIVELRHAELGSPGVYVFCMFMGNDLADLRNQYERRAPSNADDAPASDPDMLWRINDYVFHHPILKRVYTIQFVRQKILTIVNRRTSARMNPIFLAMRTDTDYLEQSVEYLREELQRLQRMSRRKRFGYVFVLIPDVHQVSAGRRKLKMEYYKLDTDKVDPVQVSREISETLGDLEIAYIDISSCLADTGSPEELYFLQDTHLTEAGHDRAATCLRVGGLLQLVAREARANSVERDTALR